MIETKKVKSIEELLKLKTEIAEDRDKIYEFYASSIDSIIKYKKASRIDILKIEELPRQDADMYNIYAHVIEPNLADKTLQEAYNRGKKPYEIVDALLKPSEVIALSREIAQVDDIKKTVADIKN